MGTPCIKHRAGCITAKREHTYVIVMYHVNIWSSKVSTKLEIKSLCMKIGDLEDKIGLIKKN